MYAVFEKLCELSHITPYKVGKATGIATSTLSDWKNGKSVPKQDKMQKIADYFGVSIDYLTTGKKTEFEIRGQEADLLVTIRHDKEMLNALEKFYKLSSRQKKHIFELIDLLGNVTQI